MDTHISLNSRKERLSEHTFIWRNAPIVYPPFGAPNPTKRGSVEFKLLCGETKGTAMFVQTPPKQASSDDGKKIGNSKFNTEEVKNSIKRRLLDPLKLGLYLGYFGYSNRIQRSKRLNDSTSMQPASVRITSDSFQGIILPSLEALRYASLVYEQIPSATVSLGVISKTLHDVKWSRTHTPPFNRAMRLDRASMFACIAYFESGFLDISPLALSNVMAMSSGNSIYASKKLLSDPIEWLEGHEVKRIVGNIGRPGIAMLMPPSNPRIRNSKPNEWRLVKHANFDGVAEDCFSNTSLHLSFTGYESPIGLGLHGLQDTEVYLLESTLSAFSREEWIADLDVLHTLEETSLISRPARLHCNCDGRSDGLSLPHLTAIDSWEELLDSPINTGVVRASKNWIGRLTTAVVAAQKGHNVLVLPDSTCWRCVDRKKVLPTMESKGRRKSDAVSDIVIF